MKMKLRATAAAIAVIAAATIGGAAATSNPAAATITATASTTTQGYLPGAKHVFVINLENKGYDETWGPASAAPYLSQTLRSQGVLLNQYYGTAHNSQPNYVAQISGQGPNPQMHTLRWAPWTTPKRQKWETSTLRGTTPSYTSPASPAHRTARRTTSTWAP
ncbi:hypothetical protein NG819_14415 [Pseudarthrobacter sp. Fe7]|nr:hypothetical protein NG819_14415 [Pseudarthrobacter sp. Fe7]